MQLLHADIIAGRGPRFFEEVVLSVKDLARELDEKVGATLSRVQLSETHSGCTLTAGALTIIFTRNEKGQQIDVKNSPPGGSMSGGGIARSFVFKVDGQGQLLARDGKREYCVPSELAADVLKEYITPELPSRS